MVEQTRKCRKCQKEFPFTELKYFNDTVNLYCKNCIEDKKNTTRREEVVLKEDIAKKIKYKCYKCGYTFMQAKSYDRGCPYCGSQKLIQQEVTGNVDKLILESSHSKYDG